MARMLMHPPNQSLESIKQRNKIPFVIILYGFPFGRKMRLEKVSVYFSWLRRVDVCGTKYTGRPPPTTPQPARR